jgi:uncharacterized protein YbjT (DUF2867 family)
MILVIGATGNTGRETALGVRATGADVRALVRNPAKAADLAAKGIDVVKGDLGDPASLATAMRGIDKIFLVTSPDTRMDAVQTAAIDAAKAAGVKHIVKLSVLGAAAEAPVLLARLHHRIEGALKSSGLAWTVLQANAFMQNFFGFAPTIISQGAIYAPAGEGRVSHVDVRDIAATAVATLTTSGHEGKTYAVTGPEAISYAEAARAISEAIGKEVKYVDVPPDAARQSLVGMGVPQWFADDLVTLMHGVFAKGYGAGVSDAVAKVTGRPPRAFKQFARDYAPVFAGESVTRA